MDDLRTTGRLLGYDLPLDRIVLAWRRRWRLIAISALIGLGLALLWLQTASYTYTATLMVSPVQSSGAGGVASKLGSIGGLASLAGVNIGTDTASQDFLLYQAGIYSRDAADALASDPEIMHTLYHDAWDASAKRWKQPSALWFALRNTYKALLGMPNSAWTPPDGAALQDFIRARVRLTVDHKSPMVTISYDDPSPAFALQLLTKLDRAVDRKLRGNAWARASQYSRYISDQLTKITNADIREALMKSLTDQEKIKMMASATAPYAAEPFGPPSVSRRPTAPRPFFVLGLGVLMGLLAGAVAAVVLPHWRREANELPQLWSSRVNPLSGITDPNTGR